MYKNIEDEKKYRHAYYEANKKKADEVSRKYRQSHREKVRARQKAWAKANREKILAKRRAYYDANKEKVKAVQRAYHIRHKNLRNQRARAKRAANPEKHREYERANRKKFREEMIAAYGGECQCCGENHHEFLTVDHVNNDGASHRSQIGPRTVYRWLRRNGYPKEGFQLLCFNCNCAKGFYGYCPHTNSAKVLAAASG